MGARVIGRLLARRELKMLHDLGLLGMGQVVTKAITFLAFAFLARRLPAAQYGAVEYAMGMATLAALATDGGLGSVGVRRLSQHEDTTERLAALVPTAQLCLSLIVAPGMFLFALVFAKDARAVTLVGLVAISVMLLPWKQDWLFQSLGRMGQIVAAQTIRVGVFALGAILLVRGQGQLNLVGVMEIVSVACATLYMMVLQQRSIAPVRTSFDLKDLVGLGREGISIGAAAIVWAMIQYAPLMMLANMAGMTDTAYFGASHRLAVSLVTFSYIYHFNLYPTIARRMGDDPQALALLTRASFRGVAWAGIGLALGMTIAASPLLALLFGERFQAAAPAFSILIWTFPVTLLSGHARWLLVAARRSHDMLTAQLAGAATVAVLGWVLIANFGAVGAAIVMLASCIAIWAAAQVFVTRHVGVAPFTPCLLPTALAAALIVAARYLTLNPWAEAVLAVAVFFALAPLLDRALPADLARIMKAKPATPPAPGMAEAR